MPVKSKKTETFLDFCDKISPCQVRFMAMTSRGPEAKRMTHRLMNNFEIAERSGLPVRTVQRIGSSKSWDGIKMGTASKFLHGCGVDIINREWLKDFLHRYADCEFPYLTTKQKNYFYRLMEWSQSENGSK